MGEDDKLELCKVVLEHLLQDGEEHETKKIIRGLNTAGVKNKSTIKQARKELGVKTKNNGDGTWSWRLCDE